MDTSDRVEISLSLYDSLLRCDNVLLIINSYLNYCKAKNEPINYDLIDLFNEALM